MSTKKRALHAAVGIAACALFVAGVARYIQLIERDFASATEAVLSESSATGNRVLAAASNGDAAADAFRRSINDEITPRLDRIEDKIDRLLSAADAGGE